MREVAKRLREEAEYPGCEIYGSVLKLVSEKPNVGGDVYVRANVDGQIRTVRLSLDSWNYAIAIEAHKRQNWIRCVGDLSRDGRRWVLTNVHDMSVVGDSDGGDGEQNDER